MTEKHFWHPERGYWVAIDCAEKSVETGDDRGRVLTRPEITAETYGPDVIEVPARPSPDHTWNGSAWDAPPEPAPEAVNDE